jgi:hypothetical protein
LNGTLISSTAPAGTVNDQQTPTAKQIRLFAAGL